IGAVPAHLHRADSRVAAGMAGRLASALHAAPPENADRGRLVEPHRLGRQRRTGRAAAAARRLTAAQRAPPPPRLPAARQAHPRGVALHPCAVHHRGDGAGGGARRRRLLLPENRMSFVLQRVTARGLVLNQVSSDTLRIGRGTNAELRSDNPAVSLDHAVITADAAGYAITDKGSITGTYVNRKPLEPARLSAG